MFIVNQNGNICVNLEKIHYTIDYDDDINKELTDIYSRIKAKEYQYGSESKCLAAIKDMQDSYIIKVNPNKFVKIYVNDNLFAKYQNIENGINIFNNIKQSIINGVLLVDLSDDKPFLQ